MSDSAHERVRRELQAHQGRETGLRTAATSRIPEPPMAVVRPTTVKGALASLFGNSTIRDHNKRVERAYYIGGRTEYARRLLAALEASGMVLTVELLRFVDDLSSRLEEGSLEADLGPEVLAQSVRRYLAASDQLSTAAASAVIDELTRH